MLNNAAVRSARPRDRAFKMGDGGGLYLFVAPSGLRSWRMKYRFDRREKLLVLGSWPELQLDDARAARDAARADLAIGVDPARADRRARPRAFEAVARAWFDARRKRWSAAHAADVIASLERSVFPAIGGRPIAAIVAADLVEVAMAIEDAGTIETARRVCQRLHAIFAFAARKGWTATNCAAALADEVGPAPEPAHQLALTTIEEARELLAACERVPAGPVVRLASRFLALTGVRLAALRGARWDEIEDVDWTGRFVGPLRPVWRVPAARMKLKLAKKGSPANDHLVPLSAPAVAVLRAARAMGGAALVFPGRDGRRPIGERAIGDLYVRAGFGGRHVPHGWRATFSTILNQQLRGERETIDEALGHATKGRVEAAYNRAVLLDRRRWLFEAWGEMLAPP